jgi:uncharacterized metal-binding protein YceD (DUF177 family)
LGKFDIYKVDLKGLAEGVHTFEYELGNAFFTNIDGDEVRKGKLQAGLSVKRTPSVFEIGFRIQGVVKVPCDRCLDDVELPVETQNRLFIKFGKEYAEESDEVVIIPENEGAINVAWFLYEFIVLAIPMKHVHAPGKCNKAVSSKLRKHTARHTEEDDDDDFGEEAGREEDPGMDDEDTADAVDPRWEALKGLTGNDNN